MLDWIMRQAEMIRSREQIKVESMAILFRLNHTLDWSLQYLKSKLGDSASLPVMLTVHKSKGLEFPVVFLCDMEDGVFPNYQIKSASKTRSVKEILQRWFKAPEVYCNWDEEKRLFYVGVTRAEKHLFLLTARRKEVYGRKRTFRRSRFLRLI